MCACVCFSFLICFSSIGWVADEMVSGRSIGIVQIGSQEIIRVICEGRYPSGYPNANRRGNLSVLACWENCLKCTSMRYSSHDGTIYPRLKCAGIDSTIQAYWCWLWGGMQWCVLVQDSVRYDFVTNTVLMAMSPTADWKSFGGLVFCAHSLACTETSFTITTSLNTGKNVAC